MSEYGLSNGQYAATAVGSLILGACIVGVVNVAQAPAVVVDAQQEALLAEESADEGEGAEAVEEAGEIAAGVAVAVEGAPNPEQLQVAVASVPDLEGASNAVLALTAPYGTDVSVVVQVVGGNGFATNSRESFKSASMIKLLVLAEYLDQVDSGELDPQDTYTLAAADVVGGSGSMQSDAIGTTYTLDEVARLMICASDNVGTNVLIDRMGFEAIMEKAAELGLDDTNLGYKLMSGIGPGPGNAMCTADAATILEGIALGTIASPERCALAEQWLLEQQDAEGIAEGLPEGVEYAHKTGTVDYIRHDGGIVYGQNRDYIIVIFTQNLGYTEANDLMAQVSAAVFAALEG